MLQQIHSLLSPVRTRQRFNHSLRGATIGVLTGAVVGLLMLFARWLGASVEAFSVLLSPVVAAALGAGIGFAWPVRWQSSARLVDGAFNLKDRTTTALAFAEQEDRDPLRGLQIEDAVARLCGFEPCAAAPLHTPRFASAAVVAVVVMAGLLMIGYPPVTSNASLPTGPLPVVLEQAAVLEETLVEELQELAEETEDTELQQLAEEMKQAIEELKKPEVDQRDALAQLSEMQATVAAALEQLQSHNVDAQLQQLGEALQDADATQAASQELKESDYDGAAEELEKLDASTMTRKEKNALSSNLAKLSSALGKGKKGELSESVQQILEGLESDKNSDCKSGFCNAAGICRKQGVKKRISECLACQLNRLSECKSCCKSGQCNSPGSKVAKSENPSNSAGRGASNNPHGEEKTKLESQRKQEDLTGIAGEGPSERETTTTAEAQQDAGRSYSEKYAEYRKQMEEVLDSEPLPLGHRETVRTYFESIRPAGEELATP